MTRHIGSWKDFNGAFTLAEMMVVMLIMSIILACMAPAVTTKMKADRDAQSSPWKWASNSSDIYFGLGAAQTAMLGQREKGVGEDAKLIIHNPTEAVQDMILFKQNDNAVGRLRIDNGGMLFGTLSNGGSLGANSIALGTSINPGPSSIAIGSNTTAFDNSVVIGASANSSAENSVAIGTGAISTDVGGTSVGDSTSAGNLSVALGQGASAGDSSVAIGNSASTVGKGGIAIGTDAIANVGDSVFGSVAIGEKTEAVHNAIAIGKEAKANKSSSIAIGFRALYANTTGSGNIVIGNASLSKNTTGSDNTAIGIYSMLENTTGNNNTAIGYWALRENTTGRGNVAIGHLALSTNTTGSGNVAIGGGLIYNTTGYSNISIGGGLTTNTTGHDNIAIGGGLYSNINGQNNIALGYAALSENINGNYNTALGFYACHNSKGSNVTCIGANSGPKSGSATVNTSNVVYLGTENDTVYIPGNLIVDGSVILGNGDKTKHVFIRGSNDNGDMTFYSGKKGDTDNTGCVVPHYKWDSNITNWFDDISLSDRRLKYVGKENQDGLSKLRQLKIFNYTYKKDEAKIPHVGVIAQDLQKVFPNAVKKGADGFLTIRMEDMFYAVINAIKELDSRVSKLENENKELRLRIEKLESKIK